MPKPFHSIGPATRVTALCLLLTTGCAAVPGAEPPGATTSVQAGTDEATRAAIRDAVRRTGLAEAQVRVAAVESVTWSDSSLGCPEPEMLYTQALVKGYRIDIRAGESRLEYHADTHGRVVYCAPDRSRPPVR